MKIKLHSIWNLRLVINKLKLPIQYEYYIRNIHDEILKLNNFCYLLNNKETITIKNYEKMDKEFKILLDKEIELNFEPIPKKYIDESKLNSFEQYCLEPFLEVENA